MTDQFVFLDDRPWPYLVRQMSDGDWWLCYWADSAKNFVTMRKLTTDEVDQFRPMALPQDQADRYLNHPKRRH